MKKTKLPLVAILALFGSMMFTSCKKDYTCSCRVIIPLVLDTTIKVEMEDYKKKEAKRTCDNNEAVIETGSSAVINGLIQQFVPDSLTNSIPTGLNFNFVNADCSLD